MRKLLAVSAVLLALCLHAAAHAGWFVGSFQSFGTGGGGGGTPTYVFLGVTEQTNDVGGGADRTFADVNFGTEDPNRVIVVAAGAPGGWVNSGVGLAGLIDGNAATVVTAAAPSLGGASIAILSVADASGTSGDVVITAPNSTARMVIAVWAIYPASSSVLDTAKNNVTAVLSSTGCNGSDDLRNITTQSGGIVIGGVYKSNTTDVTWSWNGTDAITEEAEATIESANRYSFADINPLNQTDTTLDAAAASVSATSGWACVAASWGAP